jgi:CheY-like chemotaxis protein
VLANRDHLNALKAAEVPAPAAPARALSILLAEDNADMREMTVEVLEALGHDAAGFGSGEAALAALEAHAGTPYDVLITDVGLPGMSGYQLAARARALGMRSVIFASGYAPGGTLGPDDTWLQKPFTLESIEEALGKIARAVPEG